jgi:uncharacterized membrane protein
VVILGVCFTIVSTFYARRDRPDFYLLIAASTCAIAVALITAFGNIPINNQIVTWSISSPPPNWMDLAQKWWWFQTVRTILAIGGLVFLILTALVRPRLVRRSSPAQVER